MGTFFNDHGLELLFGLIASITAILAIFYAKKSHHLKRTSVIADLRRSVQIYLTRESMISVLADMYDRAAQGDVIWFQTVGMHNYPGDVHDKILRTAGRGVSFKMIFNSNSPAVGEFKKLFEPVRDAEYVETTDNRIRVQGLSNKEVIVAFPSLTTYTAIRFQDQAFVEIIRNWFDQRYNTIRTGSP